jgi:predicted nuclease with TOPRIM domain
MTPPSDITPLGVISLSISTVIAPFVAWLVRGGSRLIKRTTRMEVRFDERMKDLDALMEASKGTDARLIRVEDAIVDIRSASQRMDEQYAAIMGELKVLARVATLIDSLTLTVSQIVPRNEVEARLKSTEARLSLVETDIRSGRS